MYVAVHTCQFHVTSTAAYGLYADCMAVRAVYTSLEHLLIFILSCGTQLVEDLLRTFTVYLLFKVSTEKNRFSPYPHYISIDVLETSARNRIDVPDGASLYNEDSPQPLNLEVGIGITTHDVFSYTSAPNQRIAVLDGSKLAYRRDVP